MLGISLSFTSCLKEDTISAPSVNDVKMYMTDKSGKDSLVTEVKVNKAVKFVVLTSADICSIWPGGIRAVVKKKLSLDGGVTYADYGLIGAKGLKTSQTAGGWYCS